MARLVQPRHDLRGTLTAVAGKVPHFEALKARVESNAHEMHFAKARGADRGALQLPWELRLRRLTCWHGFSREDQIDLSNGANAQFESSASNCAPKRDHRVAQPENSRAANFGWRMAPV
jgi:hypothetical protein